MRNIIILLSVSILLAFACKTTKTVSDDKDTWFEIIESKKENWVSGAREGYGGTDYFVKVKILTDKNIMFESIEVEGIISDLKVIKNDVIINDYSSIKIGDILLLRATQLNSNQGNLSQKINPDLNQSSAFIIIKTDNATYKQAIEQFEIVKGPLRP